MLDMKLLVTDPSEIIIPVKGMSAKRREKLLVAAQEVLDVARAALSGAKGAARQPVQRWVAGLEDVVSRVASAAETCSGRGVTRSRVRAVLPE